MSDASGSTAWTYDAHGRVSAEVKTLAGVPFTTRYTYRADDQVQSTTYPEGEVVSMGYNSRGLVESLSGSRPYLSAAAYNPGGQPLRLSYGIRGNGVTTRYTYDPQTARLSSLIAQHPTVPGVLGLGYGYEPNGNLAQVDDAGEGRTTFTYDDLDRLTDTVGAFNAHYTYSVIGNLTSKQEQGGTTTSLVYPSAAGAAQPHAPETVNGVTYDYDGNGNTTATASVRSITMKRTG